MCNRIDLWGKVGEFIECAMRKQASAKTYDAHVSEYKLYKDLHKAFTWQERRIKWLGTSTQEG